MLTEMQTLWATFFGVAIASGLVFDALFRLIWRLKDMGRAWVITVPTTPGAMARIERKRLKRGQLTMKEPTHKDEQETFVLRGEAAYPTRRGPLHLLSEYGHNLIAPTKEEAEDEDGTPIRKDAAKYQRFRIWDPLTYWRATRENDMEDLYAAQREKDHWAVKLAPVFIIALCIMMAAIGFLVWKVLPMIEGAARGA